MPVKAERFEAVLEVVLDRPEVLNAINPELVGELAAQLDVAAGDDSIRAVMLRGEGKGFCAGGDVRMFARALEEGDTGVPALLPNALHAMIEKLRALPKPVVAAVHGACAGAGFSLMLACDLAVAAEGTKFNMAYTGIGLSPDGSSSYFLPRHVGMKKACEMFMAPRNMTAEEVLELGLVNRVVPAAGMLQQARALTTMLAAGPTRAYGRVKQLLGATWTNSLHDQLALEGEYIDSMSRTDDFREGVTAFLDKRMPRFKGS